MNYNQENNEHTSKRNPITVASLLSELRKNNSPQINPEALNNASEILDRLEKRKEVETKNTSHDDIEEER